MISLEQVIQSAAWSLFHSLWQIGIIGIVIFTILQLDWLRDPKQRFGLLLTGISLSAFAFLSTFVWYMYQYSPAEAISFAGLSFEELMLMKAASESMEAEASLLVKIEVWVFANMHYLVYAWLAGVSIFLVRFAGGLWYVNRLKTHNVSMAPAMANKYLQKWAVQFPMLRKVKVLESAKVNAPLVAGIFKPVILFPIGMISQLHPSQVEAILAHEIAHILRSDMLTQTLCSLAKALLFYHPAMWWMQRSLSEEREFACDEFAINLTANPPALAKALANVKAWESNELIMAFQNKQHYLINRISRIFGMKNQTESNNYTGNLSALAIILAMLFLLPVAEGQDSPERSEKFNTSEILTSVSETGTESDARSILELPEVGQQVTDTVPPASSVKANDTIPPTPPKVNWEKNAEAIERALKSMEMYQSISMQEIQKSMDQATKSMDALKMMNFDSIQISVVKAMKVSMVDVEKALKAASESIKKMDISEEERKEMMIEIEQELAKQKIDIARELESAKLELQRAKLQMGSELDREKMRQEMEQAKAQMQQEFEQARIELQKEMEALKKKMDEERKRENKEDDNIAQSVLKQPLFVIDGVIISSGKHLGITQDQIKSIDVLKGESGILAYGERGANGVIQISTIHGNGPDSNLSGVEISTVLNNSTGKTPKLRASFSQEDILFVVNETVMPDFDFKSMDMSSVKSIEVLKGEAAIMKYGSRASDGVIKINTKGKIE